jgi:hypothetical protein
LWIVLVALVAFLIWLVASVLFGPFVYGQKAPTFEDCITVVFNGTIDPMFPKTQTNFCNFLVEKSVTGVNGTDDNALRQEFIQRYGDDFNQELMNGLNQSMQKAFSESD